MHLTVRNLIWILELFFPPELPVQQALYVLAVIISLYPLVRLHLNQMDEAYRQSPRTGWINSVYALLSRAFHEEANDPEAWTAGVNVAEEYTEYICRDLERLHTLMSLTENSNLSDPNSFFFRPARRILCTTRMNCKFCPPSHRNLVPSLRRKRHGKSEQRVWLLDSTFRWVSADLVVGYCATCKAEYYPDSITKKAGGRGQKRQQVLEYDAEYLRVSKHGVWVHRDIARAQENSLDCFHAGWSNWAKWRLFTEHFSRRLLEFHGKADVFTCNSHPATKILVEAVRKAIGEDGGVIRKALDHGCLDCTHAKRFADEEEELGRTDGHATEIAGSEAGPAGPIAPDAAPLPPSLPSALPRQPRPPPGSPRGYCRLSVMDGKSLTHKKCSLDECHGPLYNFKNGRFCEAHLEEYEAKCGILSCGRLVHSDGALTCDDPAHIDWHKKFVDRFHRLSFPGVQRVIRRQMVETDDVVPRLQIELENLRDTPGGKVAHTFTEKTTYCLQTVQWACGYPIGWGKCYRSESTPQVLSLMNKIWAGFPDLRPGFMAYDKACDLLRHIVTQDGNDLWIASTRFIVDAWHYINHRTTDILCRTRTNPAPTDGSQPDLVITQIDDNGVVHKTRAFNTETAAQLNSWLNGFESQLQRVDMQVEKKNRGLTDEFWDEVNGNV
ncbi:hypothetical protein R3P38DRAFT_3524527 [Favolaschia claudopus]|uniref:CxC5 like cysteine cluster associated with KDZ domain-containing protein n=1 Tax=Favolaschia claudopus TaxID=2862362 RepID=A0AAW0BM10_9AGAR